MKKKPLLRKGKDIDKQAWTPSVCKGGSEESQIDWIVCIIYTVSWHKEFILRTYNTWFEIILHK